MRLSFEAVLLAVTWVIGGLLCWRLARLPAVTRHGAVGRVHHRMERQYERPSALALPVRRVSNSGASVRRQSLFRLRSFETSGAFTSGGSASGSGRIGIPDAGDLFRSGASKRRLTAHDREHFGAFAAETRRAERTHWGILAAAPWFFLLSPWCLGLAMVGYGIVANVPCIAIQRYNRARLLRMIQRPSTAWTA